MTDSNIHPSLAALIEEMRAKVKTEDLTLLAMATILYLDMFLPNAIESITHLCDYISETTGLGTAEEEDAGSNN